ncbi:hypothetical protein MCEMSE6_02916 [Oxalobacteraceae bacterium]
MLPSAEMKLDVVGRCSVFSHVVSTALTLIEPQCVRRHAFSISTTKGLRDLLAKEIGISKEVLEALLLQLSMHNAISK